MTITEPGVGTPVPIGPSAPGRVSPERLVDLVLGIAADEDRWRSRVQHDVHRRRFERLVRSDDAPGDFPAAGADAVARGNDEGCESYEDFEDYEVWLICWDVGQMTLLHDHGPSSGAFVVVDGLLLEDHGHAGSGRLSQRRVPRGRARSFGPAYVHNLANPGPRLATSIHAYSPRLTTMTYYAVLPGGAVPVRSLPVDAPEPTL